ncbi:MAG: hypothetical protein ACREGA_01180 [Candidatus Saccharimonadales bacterium]
MSLAEHPDFDNAPPANQTKAVLSPLELAMNRAEKARLAVLNIGVLTAEDYLSKASNLLPEARPEFRAAEAERDAAEAALEELKTDIY